jgi:DNA binding domain, excisionase family
LQVAKNLQISRSKAYELVRSEGFPKIRLGKRLLIPKEAFEEWIMRNTQVVYDERMN